MTEKSNESEKKDKTQSENGSKQKPDVKMLNVKENSSFGVFILLIGVNIFACGALKHHFQTALKELDGHIDQLEQNTDLLYHAWGPKTIENAKQLYDQSKAWTDELVGNVTGDATLSLIERVDRGQKKAEETITTMEVMLKAYKNNDPIFDFEGDLKNDTFKPADIKQKYKIVYANGTEETDHSLIDIAKNAIIDLKTKYHTIERKIKDQRTQIETMIYAFQQVDQKKLFDHGVKFIEENTKLIAELPEKYNFVELKEDYIGLNKTAQNVLDDLKLIEHSLTYVSLVKQGKLVDVPKLREEMKLMRKDIKGMKPFLVAMRKKSQDSVSGSIASEKYMEDIKHTLEYHQAEYLWPKYQDLKKKINLEVRSKYEKYNRLVRQYTPVCVDKMGDDMKKELEQVQIARSKLHDKIEDYSAKFPDFEKWMKEFHGECQDYIKDTDVLIDELIEKVSGPVAKATRILHKRKNTMQIENNLFYRLKQGQFKSSDEDFKNEIERFNEMEYPRQIQLVRDIIQAQEIRLSKTLPESEELSEEEMGVINELADHEQASNYASAQRGKEEQEEKAAKELMEELRKLQEM